MSFKEVKILRQEGNLKKALSLAKTDLEKNEEDIWNKRSIAWVYYDLLKKSLVENDLKKFLSCLFSIKSIDLPNKEQMIFDSCAWSVGKILFANNNISPSYLDQLYKTIKDFEFSKPKESYSYLLKAFKKHADNWENFFEFVSWWDLNNFMPKDYENFVLDNGNKIPSLAESIYIAVAKILLQKNNPKKIREFIPVIANASNTYKNMQYPPYYYAKLLLALGDREHFIEAFLPFAKRKQQNFWVWDLMSENFAKDSDEYFSCLCKSLLCGAPDKFTGGVREKIAGTYVKKQMFAEAKYEYKKIIDSRKKEGWSLRDKHIAWQKLSWWDNTDATKSNRATYEKHLSVAESLLYANIAEEVLVVTRVNKEKSVFNFIVSKDKYGFSSYRKLRISPKEAQIYAVRFAEKTDSKSSFYTILSLKETDKQANNEIHKDVQGNLRINIGNSFGFIKDVFVPPHIIKNNNLKNNDALSVVAINSYNSKRKAWGWNVITIKK